MKPSILLNAPVLTVSGYGSHSRDILRALYLSNKFNLSMIPSGWGMTSNYDNYSPEMKPILTETFNNKFHSLDDVIYIQVGVPHEFRQVGRKNIGITAGLETTELPKSWVQSCNKMDHLIVPSFFQKDLFLTSGVTTPIDVIPEAIDFEKFNTLPSTEPPILPESITEKFLFLTSGQWLLKTTGNDRKQIGKIIEFFITYFSGNKNVGLVVKTMSLNTSTVDRVMTRNRILDLLPPGVEFPKIYLVHGNMTDSEMARMYKDPRIKGYISLTSGESWGRGLFEAAGCGVPLIVPGWSGYMDYLSPKYSSIINFTLENIGRENWHKNFFSPTSKWAEVSMLDFERKIEDFIVSYSRKKQAAMEFVDILKERLSFPTPYNKLISILESFQGEKKVSTPLKFVKF